MLTVYVETINYNFLLHTLRLLFYRDIFLRLIGPSCLCSKCTVFLCFCWCVFIRVNDSPIPNFSTCLLCCSPFPASPVKSLPSSCSSWHMLAKNSQKGPVFCSVSGCLDFFSHCCDKNNLRRSLLWLTVQGYSVS